ncbi:MAG TPA: SDR family oxidoreductase, partial [Clostridia bacterium]|nr:SDR family oxidoreductase [Clostridia bacterium]
YKKIALITGANSGIGRAAAVALAKKGMAVVMLCRNLRRGEAALQAVRAQSQSDDVALMLCDLADLADIQRFCRAFRARYPSLDVLINNAGVLCFDRQETKDGLELHFGICHAAHFLLTLSLLDCMRPPARVVMVGSVAHKAGRIDFDDLGMKAGYSVARAYSRAKLCNLLFTKEFARRMKGAGIAIYCVHPGAVVTGIGARRGDGLDGKRRLRTLAGKLLRFAVRTPEQAAEVLVDVATGDAFRDAAGAYIANGKIARASKRSEDPVLAQRLWELSDELTKAHRDPRLNPRLRDGAMPNAFNGKD